MGMELYGWVGSQPTNGSYIVSGAQRPLMNQVVGKKRGGVDLVHPVLLHQAVDLRVHLGEQEQVLPVVGRVGMVVGHGRRGR